MVADHFQGALPAPPRVKVDLDLSHNPLRVTYTTALVTILVLPSLVVALRLYTKVFIMKASRYADAFCLLGYLHLIALVALGFVFMNVGMGKHAWDLPIRFYSRLAELLNVQQIIYMPAILFTKISILLQLLDIFAPPQIVHNFRWYSLWILICLNTIFFTALMFIEIFQCVPRTKIWNPAADGKCININQTFVATGVINVVDDWVILILPLLWTWQLQLRRSQKIGVSLVFATGFFACITSVMRLVESIKSLDNPDISVSLVPVSLWAVAEVSAGLVVSCLPLLPRFFGHKNVRTRLAATVPSQYAGLNSDTASRTHGPEYDASLRSHDSFKALPSHGQLVVMKSVQLDQTSSLA